MGTQSSTSRSALAARAVLLPQAQYRVGRNRALHARYDGARHSGWKAPHRCCTRKGRSSVRLTAKGFSLLARGVWHLFPLQSDGETFPTGRVEPPVHRLRAGERCACSSTARSDRVVQKPCKEARVLEAVCRGNGPRERVRQLRLFDRAFWRGWEVQDLLLMDFADIRASSTRARWRRSTTSDARLLSSACPARLSRCRAMRRCALCSLPFSCGGSAYLAISNEPGINPAGRRNDAYSIQAWIRLEPFDGQDAYTVFANGDLSEEAGMSLYVARDEAS